MKPIIRFATMSLLVLTAASAQAASVINTPPSFPLLNGAEFARCTAVNVGKKPVSVTVEIINATAGSVDATTTTTVDPNERITLASNQAGNVTLFCRVTGLSKKSGTVTFVVTDNLDNPLATVTAP